METAPLLPRPKRRWSIWRKMSATFGLLLLAGVLWPFLSPDEPPPDDHDIVFEPHILTDDQNAYALIAKAVALIKDNFANSSRVGADYDDHLANQRSDMVRGKNWDAALAKQWLDGTDEIWALREQAVRTAQGQAPWGSSPDLIIPTLGRLLTLAQLAQIRAWDLAHNGKSDQAIESLIIDLRIAQRIQESQGTLIHFLQAISCRSMTLDSLRGIATEFKPSDIVLRAVLLQLQKARLDQEAFAHSMRSDYRLLNWILEVVAKGQPLGPDTPLPALLRIGAHIPLLLKPNKTRRIYLDYLRQNLGAIDRAAGARGNLRSPESQAVFDPENNDLSPNNFLGRKILAIVTPTYEGILHGRLRAQSTISATEAFLALVLYHREHGELPVTLAALVPAYLPAVPRDYLDGQPIRYSREFRAVWSVGYENFAVTRLDLDADQTKYEIYLPLDFAARRSEARTDSRLSFPATRPVPHPSQSSCRTGKQGPAARRSSAQ